MCASSRVVQDFFLRVASVFNRFLREVHIHSGSPHLVQCLSAHNGTGCALMCCMCASMCTCTYTSAVVTSDMDCCSLDVTQTTRTLGRQVLFTIWTHIFFNSDKYIYKFWRKKKLHPLDLTSPHDAQQFPTMTDINVADCPAMSFVI